MSKVGVTDHEGTKFIISLLRYAIATNDKSFVLYTSMAMLAGGLLTLWLMFILFMGGLL